EYKYPSLAFVRIPDAGKCLCSAVAMGLSISAQELGERMLQRIQAIAEDSDEFQPILDRVGSKKGPKSAEEILDMILEDGLWKDKSELFIASQVFGVNIVSWIVGEEDTEVHHYDNGQSSIYLVYNGQTDHY